MVINVCIPNNIAPNYIGITVINIRRIEKIEL